MDFEWPEDIVSYATPHVKTGFSSLTINPRVYKYGSPYLKDLTRSYSALTKVYYEQLNGLNIPAICSMLKRKVDGQGRHPPTNGSKTDIITRLFEYDYIGFVNLYHPIRNPEYKALIEALFGNEEFPVCTTENVVPLADIISLRPDSQMTQSTITSQ